MPTWSPVPIMSVSPTDLAVLLLPLLQSGSFIIGLLYRGYNRGDRGRSLASGLDIISEGDCRQKWRLGITSSDMIVNHVDG